MCAVTCEQPGIRNSIQSGAHSLITNQFAKVTSVYSPLVFLEADGLNETRELPDGVKKEADNFALNLLGFGGGLPCT